MKLGVFSISLTVKDLSTSKVFYEKLGFSVFAGEMAKNYLIMKNENTLIGLFQGMFHNNILTFNPGWNESAKELSDFDDVRKIHQELKEKGLEFTSVNLEKETGPGSFVMVDPDGNPILVDQHV